MSRRAAALAAHRLLGDQLQELTRDGRMVACHGSLLPISEDVGRGALSEPDSRGRHSSRSTRWYVARESVVEGHIVPVLQDHALPAQEMHAVFPSPKLVPAKVTGFIAWLQQQLDGPWWTRAF